MRRAGVLIIAVLLITGLCGCAGASRKGGLPSGEGMLEPQGKGRFTDLPVPAGFKFIPANSYSFESAGVRVGVLNYAGKADAEQVVSFYRDQMPLYNWNLLNVIEYGERLMNFERENETCIVRILARGRSVNLSIAVGPKSGARPKKAEKPVK